MSKNAGQYWKNLDEAWSLFDYFVDCADSVGTEYGTLEVHDLTCSLLLLHDHIVRAREAEPTACRQHMIGPMAEMVIIAIKASETVAERLEALDDHDAE